MASIVRPRQEVDSGGWTTSRLFHPGPDRGTMSKHGERNIAATDCQPKLWVEVKS